MSVWAFICRPTLRKLCGRTDPGIYIHRLHRAAMQKMLI